ncbi:MAG: hypothetical protein H6736_01490 [Alphaproteobacteria bacterium]|nr:hypothetical protein [Myxococcales bacterium]MCB9690464.1 hypothetical protein [Alphaproteobacteria bacterium]
MPRQKPVRTPLQLLPIANLATLLVPIGLMVTQLVALRWLQPAPEPFPHENARDAVAATVVPTVVVTEEGFQLFGAEDVLAGPDGRPELPCLGPCGETTYDYAALRRLLGHVKAAYPRSDSLVVERQADVSYAVLVQVFTSVQTDGEADLFPRVGLR